MSIHQSSFFKFQKELLEHLFRKETLESPGSRHEAAFRWRLITKILKQGSAIIWPTQREETRLLAATLLDGATFMTITEKVDQMQPIDLSEYGDTAVQTKITSRINDPKQFLDLMVELSLAAWHKREGHRITPFEKEGWPDLAVDVEGFEYPIFLECKRVEAFSKQRLAKHIQKANSQLKKVGTPSYGVVLLDWTAAIGSEIAPIHDETPHIIVQLLALIRHAISGAKNRSVSRVIVVWDDAGVLGEPPARSAIFLRRNSAFIDHEPVAGITLIPPELPLFRGTTIELMVQWDTTALGIKALQCSELMKECCTWFDFRDEELIDAFTYRDKWQLITIGVNPIDWTV
jgi:hypothetical protein